MNTHEEEEVQPIVMQDKMFISSEHDNEDFINSLSNKETSVTAHEDTEILFQTNFGCCGGSNRDGINILVHVRLTRTDGTKSRDHYAVPN